MELAQNIYEDIKKQVHGIFEKNIRLPQKLRSICIAGILVFAVLPVAINFLAYHELKSYINLVGEASKAEDVRNPGLEAEYKRIETYLSNTTLPINDVKNNALSLFKELPNRYLKDLPDLEEQKGGLTIAGFGRKDYIARTVFWWNFIFLSVVFFLVAIFVGDGKKGRIVSFFKWFFGFEAFTFIYCYIISSIFSRIFFVTIYSAEMTRMIAGILSMGVPILGFYKLGKAGA